MKAHYIVNWKRAHTKSDHRKSPHGLAWISVPTRHDTVGYKRVARLANPHATPSEIYCAYELMAQVSACLPLQMQGWLVDRDGRPLTAEDLEDRTLHPARIFQAAFEELVFERIGWLALLELPDFSEHPIPEETQNPPESVRTPPGLRTDGRTDDTATARPAHPAPVRCGAIPSAPLRAGAVPVPARWHRGELLRPAPPRPAASAAESGGEPDTQSLVRQQTSRLWAERVCDELADSLRLGMGELDEQRPAMMARFVRIASYENRGELAAELIQLARDKRGRKGVRDFWRLWQAEGDKLISRQGVCVEGAKG